MQCAFSDGNGVNQSLIISLSVVLPSVCLFVLLAFGVFAIYFRYKNQSQKIDFGGIPVLKKVTILEQIGSGHFGSVFKGKKQGGSLVALKTVPREEISGFLSEMELMVYMISSFILGHFGQLQSFLALMYYFDSLET